MSIRHWLEPLELGRHRLPTRIMPGPMEGVMGPLFCRTMIQMKLLDMWVTPFVAISTAVPRKSRLAASIHDFTSAGIPSVVQLLGRRPQVLAGPARRLEEMGVTQINLNFACPSARVLGSGGGGSLLQHPKSMTEILCCIRDACRDICLSAKLRTGFKDAKELPGIVAAVQPYCDFIIVHSRTVEEFYRPIEHGFQRIATAVALAGDTPVIASGDVRTPDDAFRLHEVAGCAGVAVARGLLKNPFLIREIQSAISETSPTTANEARTAFYLTMLNLIRTDPELRWHRGVFLEMADHFWGTTHPVFLRVRELHKPDFVREGFVEKILNDHLP